MHYTSQAGQRACLILKREFERKLRKALVEISQRPKDTLKTLQLVFGEAYQLTAKPLYRLASSRSNACLVSMGGLASLGVVIPFQQNAQDAENEDTEHAGQNNQGCAEVMANALGLVGLVLILNHDWL